MSHHYHVRGAGSAEPQDHAHALGEKAGLPRDQGRPAEQQKAVSTLRLRRPPLEFFVCFQAFFLNTEGM